MKRAVALIAGLALTGGMATATGQQQQDAQEYDPDRSIVTEDERESRTGMDEPTGTGEDGTQTDTRSDEGLVTRTTEESIKDREEFDMSDLTPDQ